MKLCIFQFLAVLGMNSVIVVVGEHVNKPCSTSASSDVQACRWSQCAATTTTSHCRLRSTRARSTTPQCCQGTVKLVRLHSVVAC